MFKLVKIVKRRSSTLLHYHRCLGLYSLFNAEDGDIKDAATVATVVPRSVWPLMASMMIVCPGCETVVINCSGT